MKKNRNILIQLIRRLIVIPLLSMVLFGCKKEKTENAITVFEANGDINQKLNEFRQLLGNQLNVTPGSVGGRREINWDAVPADLLNKPLAGNFFNTPGSNVPATRQKGLVYTAAVDNFQVSNDGFISINASTASAFSAFSGNQTFTNVGSNLWDIGFQVPGQPLPATIKGFGLVFSDVDVDKSTFIEFFDGPRSLGKFSAPVHDAGSKFSFLGVYFKDEKITHVRVSHDGTLAEGGNDITAGGQRDFVVFDDFLFDEPVMR
jgi:hypothetical protein